MAFPRVDRSLWAERPGILVTSLRVVVVARYSHRPKAENLPGAKVQPGHRLGQWPRPMRAEKEISMGG